MATIESAFAHQESAGMESPSVSDIAPPVSALSSSKGAVLNQLPPTQVVTDLALTDESREQAIQRAAALVEYLHAVYRAYEALWHRHGDFTAKADFDRALSDCHKARELMESLIKGRSPAYVAFLEKQRGLDLPACANEGTR